jgi:hypothetical protein
VFLETFEATLEALLCIRQAFAQPVLCLERAVQLSAKSVILFAQ